MPHLRHNDDPVEITEAGEPIRQCAVLRTRRPQTEMVRFVRGPDASVVPDLAAKLPGRGVWITASLEAVSEAESKQVFSRGFKAGVQVESDLGDLVESLLVKRLQSTLGLAKKAGSIVLGFDQVKSTLQKRRPGVMISAGDGSADGRNKLYFLAESLYGNCKITGALTSGELGMAFGRSHVVHALLETGAFSRNWMADYNRLIGFRSAPEQDWYSGTQQT
ncbi:MAG: RNA-binding protein [Pseudomonadota bacterium]